MISFKARIATLFFLSLLLIGCGSEGDGSNSVVSPSDTPLEDDDASSSGGSNNEQGAQVTTDFYINSPPTFSANGSHSAKADAGQQTVVGWAHDIDDGDADLVQALHFELSNDRPDLFDVQPAVNVDTGDLSYNAKNELSGTALITLVLVDDGGVENEGVDRSVVYNFAINVDPPTVVVTPPIINNKPTFTAAGNHSARATDGPQATPAWARNLDDGNSNVTQSMNFVVTANSAPQLFDVQPSVSVPSGTLRYNAKNDVQGTAVITIVLKDDGGTENGGHDTSDAYTFSIEVTAPRQNHAPSFTPGGDVSVDSSSGSYEQVWATAMDDGDPETSQAMRFEVLENSNPALFSVQPWVSYPSGTLRFVPIAGKHGVATVRIVLKDNGGVLNNGIDTSTATEFSISLTAPVNQVPTAPSIEVEVESEAVVGEALLMAVTLGTDPDGDQVKARCIATHSNFTEQEPYISDLKDGGSIVSTSIQFDSAGVNTISCKTIDPSGAESVTAEKSVTVAEVELTTLTANAGPDQTVEMGNTVTFDGSGSDGDIVTYEWRDESGEIIGTSVSFTKADFTVATHIITLTVIDDNNEVAIDTVSIVVTETTVVSYRPLNDTGITWGRNYPEGNNDTCIGGNIAEQDCSLGRDAEAAAGTLNKVGAGSAGFDFTKVDGNGHSLPVSASSWDCVQDNHTGLLWEAKQDSNFTSGDSLHDANDSFSWYNTDSSTNGGFEGYPRYFASGGDENDNCFGYQEDVPSSYCNTEAYTARVNAAGLCGYNDWRMPSLSELRSIVDYGRYQPAIDIDYFPSYGRFWSATPYVHQNIPSPDVIGIQYGFGDVAHSIRLYDGGTEIDLPPREFFHLDVRLVRERQ